MTDSFDVIQTDPPSESSSAAGRYNKLQGAGMATRFVKGTSGHPAGRPKRPEGVSIKEILDGDQRGKNGEVISRREAYVIALVNEAMRGNQKAFSKFMSLMQRSGLLRQEVSTNPSVLHVREVQMTREEFERNF